MTNQVLIQGLSFFADIQMENDKKLVEIEEEWIRSASYHRKKKKKVRKKLEIDYGLFSYLNNMFEL